MAEERNPRVLAIDAGEGNAPGLVARRRWSGIAPRLNSHYVLHLGETG
jgi:hypothetical protein